ncbi:MAG: ddlA1 [Gammaproteobacteria bacterium]|nr:ddlA1 [Gammaproteobacteria bacterium]
MATVIPEPSSSSRTLGPVADLEKHLPSDWWRTLFNSFYLKTDGDVIENDDNTFREIEMLINAVNLKPEDKVLDLCCGQGRHVLALQRRGYENVMGLDRSRYLIRVAKKRAQQLNLVVKFAEGDARRIRLPESSLDCVVLFGNSFGYFESQEDDLAVLNSILRVLKTEGHLVMDIVNGEWMREHFEPRSWEWIDETHFVCRERSLSNDKTRIISREVIVHAERGVIADQFYAERIYTFAEIKQILASLNFTDIILHGGLVADSTRNQDLGMMANRMFISAKAPYKAKTALSTAVKTKKSLLVLLGDPRQPDKIKRNGQFNAEDLHTIQCLKDALATLNYNVNYLDNHKKLIDTLRQNKPQFVLNFCDEGFNNDALLELHVPALLEMLNIPYSGAAPPCLALCYNKSAVRAVAQSMEIPVPLETYYDPSDQAATLPSIFPAILKPNLGDSSIGITQDAVVNNPRDLVNYLDRLKTLLPNTPILIQEYLSGAEYSVGIIGNPGHFTILPIMMVDYSHLPKNLPKILGYESKWLPDSAYWNNISYKAAELDVEAERLLSDYATMLFERLGCRDYARFDFRADEQGQLKLLEVNPNPGWCWDGKFNLMASFAGKSYSEMLHLIIEAALERTHNHKQKTLEEGEAA